MRQLLDARALNDALAGRMLELVEALGLPIADVDRREICVGRGKGSLRVRYAGDKLGSWIDHANPDDHGGPLDLIIYARRDGFLDAAQWASDWLGGSFTTAERKKPTPSAKVDGENERIAKALKRWNRTEAASSIVRTYLAGRGLTLPSWVDDDIRFDPNCWHPKAGLNLPAMVALMRDVVTNEPTGIHCTYLDPDGAGKAKVSSPKLMFGRARGACVKLCDDAEVVSGLAIAEGIENAIAVQNLGWRAVWAVLSAGGMQAFPVLPGVECLTIFVDVDDAGEAAAHACCARWVEAGLEVTIRRPFGERGVDWNDKVRAA